MPRSPPADMSDLPHEKSTLPHQKEKHLIEYIYLWDDVSKRSESACELTLIKGHQNKIARHKRIAILQVYDSFQVAEELLLPVTMLLNPACKGRSSRHIVLYLAP